MAGLIDLSRILHHIRVKLYPNYLPNAGKGTYIARTDSDKTVDIKDICSIIVTRTGFEGQFESLFNHVTQFFDELIYQLFDGFTINLGYISIHPNVGGVFQTPDEPFDPKKHPISFRFCTLSKLRSLAKNIDVEIVGVADTNGYIGEFHDFEAQSTNAVFVPGDQFAVCGHKIKIAGDDPSCGVYIVPVDDPAHPIKITRLADNTASRITGVLPNNHTGLPLHRIEIRTQYTGSGTSTLKAPRVIASAFTLEEN